MFQEVKFVDVKSRKEAVIPFGVYDLCLRDLGLEESGLKKARGLRCVVLERNTENTVGRQNDE